MFFQAEPQITLQHFEEKNPARVQKIPINYGESSESVLEKAPPRADMLLADRDFQLIVIAVVLAVTTVASLIKSRRDPAARAHAGAVLSTPTRSASDQYRPSGR